MQNVFGPLQPGVLAFGLQPPATVWEAYRLPSLRRLHAGPFGRLNRVVDQVIVPLFAGCSLADFALISLVGGLGEELLFRGLVQTALVSWFSVGVGIGLASLLFGLAHMITPMYAVLATIIGVYFGWLALYAGDLLAPIVAHAVYDFAALAYLPRRVPCPGERQPKMQN